MRPVRLFEERACENGFSPLVKHTHQFSEELGTSLNLVSPEPSCSLFQAPEKSIGGHQVRQHFKKAVGEKLKEKVGDQKWQGCLLWTRWEDDQLSKRGCFSWLNGRACATTHAVPGVMELYEQLLSTRVYSAYKNGTSDQINIM